MKKITALLVALLMIVSLAACGGQSTEQGSETDTDTVSEVSGIVESLEDAQLSIFTEANQDLTFNVENAEFDTEETLRSGDTATVEYTGEVTDGDTSGCKVTKVTGEAGQETTITGTVESVNTDRTVTISSNGKQYTFAPDDVSSVKKGDVVKIAYAGVIDGEDTAHAYVRKMEKTSEAEKADETTEDKVSVKAVNDTVYTTAAVNVRAEAGLSGEIITTVAKGTKLSRTGVLSNGWSRVTYKDKDRYIASSYLTKKDPEKKTESKKDTKEEAKKDSSNASGESSNEKSSEKKEEKSEQEVKPEEKTEPDTPAVDPEEPEEPEEPAVEPEEHEEPEEPAVEPEEPEEEPEPATLTVKGVVKEFAKDSIELEDGKKFNTKDAKIDGDLDEENAVGQTVEIEYTEDTTDAVHVYPVDAEKGGDSSGSAAATVGIIALLAAVAAGAYLVIRGKRKTE